MANMLAQWAPLGRWADGPLGTNGVILTGEAGGAEDGAVGPDRYSGLTFSVTSWPSHSGLTAITPRSGATEMYSSGMPYSGPVPTMPTAQPITMFTVGTLRDERALRVIRPAHL